MNLVPYKFNFLLMFVFYNFFRFPRKFISQIIFTLSSTHQLINITNRRLPHIYYLNTYPGSLPPLIQSHWKPHISNKTAIPKGCPGFASRIPSFYHVNLKFKYLFFERTKNTATLWKIRPQSNGMLISTTFSALT